MKIVILPPGEGATLLAGAENGERLAAAAIPCPACRAYPVMVRGVTPHVVESTDRRHRTEWEAVTVCCGQAGWTIGAERESLFGFAEDAAVLNGRPRVY